jgi:excisionase family DNA binding protein
MSNDSDCETMSVPEAGRKYLGLKRDASYRAAKRKEIPTVSIGRLLRVPKRAMERLLDAVGEAKSNDDQR